MMIDQLYKAYLEEQSVTTDTRKIQAGDIFFALSGPNFDGNDYVLQAIDKGAAYCISDRKDAGFPGNVFIVDNVLTCLQELAAHHRKHFKIPFIAITGSNGKTTTKELMHAVLSKRFRCYTTEGNLNNHIGVPLTLLKIKADAEIAIVEMGANHMKEIESYCDLVQPTHGIITNCGKAHLEGFGSEENIKKGKGELYKSLEELDGMVFLNNELDYLVAMSANISKIYTYGTHDADVTGAIVPGKDFLCLSVLLDGVKTLIETNLVGDYNFSNAMAAAAVGHYFKVEATQIADAIGGYDPGNSRSQLISYKSNMIVLDAYNANPSSMKLAIENFAKKDPENKILYIGGMKEMGEYEYAEHESIVALIDACTWKEVILIGKEFGEVAGSHTYFENTADARNYFQKKEYTNEHILIKGSRGLALEKLLEA